MKLEKSKLLMPLLGVTTLGLLSVSTWADDNMQKRSQYDRKESTSTQHQNNNNSQFRQITPNAGPTVHNGADIFITASFIYWRAYQDGLNYATPAPFNAAWGFTDVESSAQAAIGTDWGPGFKIALGLDTSHDGWDVYAEYTWNSFAETSKIGYAPSTVATGATASKLLNPNDSSLFRSDDATANWKLRFNKIDLMLGRNFFLSQYLTMKPAVGFTGTWQHQNMTAKYTRRDTSFAPAGLTPAPTLNAYVKNELVLKQYGIGLRLGSDFAWYMTKQFSLYSNLFANLYWTDYTTQSNKETLHSPDNSLAKTYIDQSNDDHYAVKFAGEVELGIMWETYFCENDYHFAARLGWEMQNWVNWARFGNGATMHDGSLSFQGANVKFRFDF